MESASVFVAGCVDFVKRHRKIFIIGLIIIIIAIVVAMLAIQLKNAKLSIFVAPSDAEITINGQTYDNDGTYKFYPGKVEIVIKKDGFETRTDTVELTANHTTEYNTYLLPENGDLSVYLNSKDEYENLRQLYNYDVYRSDDEKLDQLFDTQLQRASISEKLPLFIHDAKVSGVKDPYDIFIRDDSAYDNCNKSTCLFIFLEKKKKKDWGYDDPANAEEELRSQALAAIVKLGYNPDDYAITWSRNIEDY